MKQISNFLFCLVASVFAMACESVGDCAKREGVWIVTELAIEPFNKVAVNQNIDLQIIPSTEQKLELEFGTNLLDEFSAQVKDGVLTLENLNNCNWSRSYRKPKVFLYTPTLEAISQYGFGNITCSDTLFANILNIEVKNGSGDVSLMLSTNSFSLVSNGSANITLMGKTDVFKPSFYWNNGRLYAYDFKADQVVIRHRGYNDLFIWADDEILGHIENEGNVYYKGTPTAIAVEETWNGRLISDN